MAPIRSIAMLALATCLLPCGAAPVSAQDLIPSTPAQPALAHHTVTTFNSEAQLKFDEGLTLVYAFNRDEAAKRFARAAQLDPSLAMAWWGIALANGPNLNFGMNAARLAAAKEALAKATRLAPGASQEEQRYVAALAVRYPQSYAGAEAMRPGYLAYRDALAKLHADYPDDLDAATLYAESVMDVEGWGWTPSGQPTGSAALVAPLLESVLARNPDHVGANHYYVHVMDFPGAAERALPSAMKLSALPAEPAASHLVHMSGHNYLDNGLFGPLERDNKIAVDDDRRYAASIGKTPAQLDYFFHNLDFYLGGTLMLDDRAETERALSIALSTRAKGPNQGVEAIQALAFARERRWDDVLRLPPAPTDAPGFEGFTMRYARGVALAAKHDARSAHAELTELDKAVAEGSGFAKTYGAGLSKLLGARIAHLEGDDAAAAAKLRDVIATVASLPPEVFAPWYYPTGEWLGEILFQSGDFAGAETAFRADLKRTPHNARALFGLMQTLSREGKTDEARTLSLEIAQNWRGPMSDLRLDE